MNEINGYYILPDAQTTLCSLERWTHTTCTHATEEGKAQVLCYMYEPVREPKCIVTGSRIEGYSISDAEVDVNVSLESVESEVPFPVGDRIVKAEVLKRVLRLSVEDLGAKEACLTCVPTYDPSAGQNVYVFCHKGQTIAHSWTAGGGFTRANMTVTFKICPKSSSSRPLRHSDVRYVASLPKKRDIWEGVLQDFSQSTKRMTLSKECLRAESTTYVMISRVLPGHIAMDFGGNEPICGELTTSFTITPTSGTCMDMFNCNRMFPSDWHLMASDLVDDRGKKPESRLSYIVLKSKEQQISGQEAFNQSWEGEHSQQRWNRNSGDWSYVPFKVKLEFSVVRTRPCFGDCGGCCDRRRVWT